MGVSRRATTRLANTASAAVQPNCLKNLPGCPHEGRGQEHRDQREGGGDHGQADLVAASIAAW